MSWHKLHGRLCASGVSGASWDETISIVVEGDKRMMLRA